MVFQKPNPFPKSIYENVAYGPRIHGLAKNKAELDRIVESSLQKAALWNEVKDRLQQSGHRPVRRPAAAPVHRARHRGQPGSDPDGRAVLGARPDRHRQGRGTDRRAAAELHDRHRHPLDAAGGARVAAHGDVPSRLSRRGRARPTRCSPTPTTSARRTTSPAGSAERLRTDTARTRTGSWVNIRFPRSTRSRSYRPADPRHGRSRRASMVVVVDQRCWRPTMRWRSASSRTTPSWTPSSASLTTAPSR